MRADTTIAKIRKLNITAKTMARVKPALQAGEASLFDVQNALDDLTKATSKTPGGRDRARLTYLVTKADYLRSQALRK